MHGHIELELNLVRSKHTQKSIDIHIHKHTNMWFAYIHICTLQHNTNEHKCALPRGNPGTWVSGTAGRLRLDPSWPPSSLFWVVRVSLTGAEKELKAWVLHLLSGSTLLIPLPPLSFPDPGSETECVSWCHWVQSVPSFLGVWEVVLARYRVDVQWVLSLQMGSLWPEKGKATSIITESFWGQNLSCSEWDSFLVWLRALLPAPACPIPGLSLI